MYDKLVRDRIPDMIRKSGKKCETAVFTESEYRGALLAKLVEEAQEAAQAAPAELATELADLLEVFDATIDAHGLSRAAIEQERSRRRLERGGFEARFRLLWTD
jgi:predicted house-cleaning noncanonical NTP pyrophosphatase (MazG superfamily)